MQSGDAETDISKTILAGIQGIDKYLAVINGGLEVLIMSDLPDYVKSDLANLYQAEKEASQIVRNLSIFYQKNM